MSDKRIPPPEDGQSKKPELSLEDTLAAKVRLRYPDKAARAGQDPYRLDEVPKPGEEKQKPTDLRELSKWIKAKREIEQLKAAEQDKDADKNADKK